MPSAAARRLFEDQIPSFMSVFDLGAENMDDRESVTVVDPKFMEPEALKASSESQPTLRPVPLPSETHRHNDSTSTRTTESAESSPTTDPSCTDSSSISDPSPSSSPDSPINLMPLSSFGGAPFGALVGMSALTVSGSSPERPMTSPAPRRPKNMKGLSIQPPFSSLSSTLVSEPSSPSFIKPMIPAMKRKPSQLSLKTNSTDLMTKTTLEVPSSPALPPILQRRALKHSTSSPHMLSGLKSATFGPVGGMTIPTVLERNESGLSSVLRPPKPQAPALLHGFDTTILEEDSPIRTQIANRAAFDFEPHHEAENNEDQKTPGYPDGPIAIYGDNVYLYLEPNAEEASRFDVVINVAREVKNPFDCLPKNSPPQEKAESPIPETAATTASFATAFEFIPDGQSDTPTTPKASQPPPLKEPEYIHMPWDHNTDIGPDLMTLCETIEKKTKDGKKVLVHCQQGASRSASLIIAYGMYQNPELSVNDAYYAAQSKSQWISPNMRLMYCLQDFQKEVSKRRLAPGSAFRPRSGRSPTKHRATLSADNINMSPKEPLSAPLPGEESSPRGESPVARSPNRARGNSTPNRGEPISPGPSSAPSSFSWRDMDDRSPVPTFPLSSPPTTEKSLQPGPSLGSDLGSGFGSLNALSRPPPSPRFASGFAPLSLSRSPASPGFGSFPSFSKPPPSPGFGSHRFGAPSDGFGLVPLNLAAPPPRRHHESKDIVMGGSVGGMSERRVTILRGFSDDTALMSPRAETMTNNPLHESPFSPLSHSRGSVFPGMQFVEVPPTPSEGVFSPRETMFPRDPFFPFGRPSQTADPRSPPTKGETPIVRSIDELI